MLPEIVALSVLVATDPLDPVFRKPYLFIPDVKSFVIILKNSGIDPILVKL